MRWHHPERGLVPPRDFIAVAEENGLIEPIGRWVLEQACRQAAEWHRSLPRRRRSGSRSTSRPSSSSSRGLPETVADALRATRPGSRLRCSLEITESVMLRDDQMLTETLRG